MEKQKYHNRIRFLKVALSIFVVLLFTAPCGAQYIVDGNEAEDIDFTITEGDLWVYGKANLHPGAIVPWAVYAFDGSEVNIYAGQVGFFVTLLSETSSPIVTVYGKDFTLDDSPIDPSVTQISVDSYYGGTLKGTYKNGDTINLWFMSEVPINLVHLATNITIDIKPGSDQNRINLKSKGVVPVAILTDGFDAATVDPATARFAGAAPERWKIEDIDGDGDDDMLLHFRTKDLDLDPNITEATLSAQLLSAQLLSEMALEGEDPITVSGTDMVQIIPAKKK